MNIRLGLNLNDIDAAIKQLEAYQNSLPSKLETFVRELARVGIAVGRGVIAMIKEEDLEGTTLEFVEPIIDQESDLVIGAAINLVGEKVAFIEFSAGITYGTFDYPLPSGDPYGMGTYPGKGHWADPHGWWYPGDDGEYHRSYGNRAYMPMYYTSEGIHQQIAAVARSVFQT